MRLEQINKIISKERMLEIFRHYVKKPFTCSIGEEKKYPDAEWLIVRKNRKRVCAMNITNLIHETVEAFAEKAEGEVKPFNDEHMKLLFLEAFNEIMLIRLAPLLVIMEDYGNEYDGDKLKGLVAKKLEELKVNAQFRVGKEEDIKKKKWEVVEGEV